MTPRHAGWAVVALVVSGLALAVSAAFLGYDGGHAVGPYRGKETVSCRCE